MTFLSISTTYHRESFKFTEMTGIKLYLLTQFPNQNYFDSVGWQITRRTIAISFLLFSKILLSDLESWHINVGFKMTKLQYLSDMFFKQISLRRIRRHLKATKIDLNSTNYGGGCVRMLIFTTASIYPIMVTSVYNFFSVVGIKCLFIVMPSW